MSVSFRVRRCDECKVLHYPQTSTAGGPIFMSSNQLGRGRSERVIYVVRKSTLVSARHAFEILPPAKSLGQNSRNKTRLRQRTHAISLRARPVGLRSTDRDFRSRPSLAQVVDRNQNYVRLEAYAEPRKPSNDHTSLICISSFSLNHHTMYWSAMFIKLITTTIM